MDAMLERRLEQREAPVTSCVVGEPSLNEAKRLQKELGLDSFAPVSVKITFPSSSYEARFLKDIDSGDEELARQGTVKGTIKLLGYAERENHVRGSSAKLIECTLDIGKKRFVFDCLPGTVIQVLKERL